MGYLICSIDYNITIGTEDFAKGVELLGLSREFGSDLPRALEEHFGFDTYTDGKGAIIGMSYDGKLYTDLDKALIDIAPVMSDGDYIAFQGEEPGDYWRYVYQDGVAETQYGSLEWRSPQYA